jgi:hypothetical protein
VLSSFILATTAPSLESLSALFSAIFCPFLRKMLIAASKSPSASTKAFLQSIIPAPVAFLNLFTSAAVIFAIVFIFYNLKKVVKLIFATTQPAECKEKLNDFKLYYLIVIYSSSLDATAFLAGAFFAAGLVAFLASFSALDCSLSALRSFNPSTIASVT